jgi:hypothetical protein
MPKVHSIVTVFLSITLLLSTMAGGVVAQEEPPEEYAERLLAMFQENKTEFNEALAEADLGPAGPRLAGKTTNVVISDESDAPVMWFEMNDRNQVVAEGLGDNPDAELTLITTNATINSVLTGPGDRAEKFVTAYANDDIEIVTDYSFTDAITSGRTIDWVFWNVGGVVKGWLF